MVGARILPDRTRTRQTARSLLLLITPGRRLFARDRAPPAISR
jgi:hypothetical protein